MYVQDSHEDSVLLWIHQIMVENDVALRFSR